jgi:hypothetical protein
MGKGFDSPYITPSFRGVLSVGLVIEGTIVIIVPLIASFLLDTILLLVAVFNLVVCISVADHVAQVSIIPVSPLTVVLW